MVDSLLPEHVELGWVAHVIIVSPQSQLDFDLDLDCFGFGIGSKGTGLGTRA